MRGVLPFPFVSSISFFTSSFAFSASFFPASLLRFQFSVFIFSFGRWLLRVLSLLVLWCCAAVFALVLLQETTLLVFPGYRVVVFNLLLFQSKWKI
ncbi:uncharacterized protein LOC125480921 isoform X2 [Pyrus x bretschneideri]|uniref:uncharacterized protein LOC125480921 isoform X2 n=1 Tax=Pyrus x bretschneideri TaxID=225117 RepID=UPI00202F8837|nr:uncharacterized protein LOC125480921 isoform X2 [Pyrus x bretschneideri]